MSCYVEFGNRLQFEGGVVDRGSALQLLHVIPEPRQAQGAVRCVRAAVDGAQRSK